MRNLALRRNTAPETFQWNLPARVDLPVASTRSTRLSWIRVSSTTFGPRIEALTPADIQRAAAKYFDTYRAAIVIVGDWEKVKDQVTPFGDVTMYDAEGNVISKS